MALFHENSANKASGLLFIFVCISTDHTHLQNNEIRVSWEPTRNAMVFTCETTENTTRKAGFVSLYLVCGLLLPVNGLLMLV